MNRTLNVLKNISTHFFSIRDIFMRGATFSTRGREISFLAGESISHLAEIEYPGGEETFTPGGRLYMVAIPFRVTGQSVVEGEGGLFPVIVNKVIQNNCFTLHPKEL